MALCHPRSLQTRRQTQRDQTWSPALSCPAVYLSGGGSNTSFAGNISSSADFTSVTNLTAEVDGGDIIDTTNPKRITVQLRAIKSWNDSFRFKPQLGADLCVSSATRDPVKVLVGKEAKSVTTPFNPETLQSCTTEQPESNCGRPDMSNADGSLMQLWKECGTNLWHVRIDGAGSDNKHSGQIVTAGINNIIDLSLELDGGDKVQLSNNNRIDLVA